MNKRRGVTTDNLPMRSRFKYIAKGFTIMVMGSNNKEGIVLNEP